MDLRQAVGHPRVFLLKDELRLESSMLADSTILKLQQLDYKLMTYSEPSGWFGRVHAIKITNGNQKKLSGAADPRDYGAAAGY
jgi:gamma-glutamyltranspeptidase